MTENVLPEKQVNQPSKLAAAEEGAKQRLWTFLGFLGFISLVAILYMQNRWQWEDTLQVQKVEIDSLRNYSTELSLRMDFIQQAEAKRVESMKKATFDFFDENRYRVYGMYRDRTKKQTRESMSQRFNVYNAGAIEMTEALGERWFTVPVKGVHFMRKDETLESITKLYYSKLSDSTLIVQFNPKIKPLRSLFIPFGN